jgi:hypothetical protein
VIVVRTRSPRLVFALSLAVAVVAGGCLNAAPGSCTAAAAAAFREIDQYEGLDLEPEDYPLGGRCAASFISTDPIETVLDHYRTQWTAAGWTLDPAEPLASAPPSGEENPDFVFGSASSRKDGMTYSVRAQREGEEVRYVLLVGPDQ